MALTSMRRSRKRLARPYLATSLLLPGGLVVAVVAGCTAQAADPEPSVQQIRAALVQAHSQIRNYAEALARAAGRSHLSSPPAVFGSFEWCPEGHDRIAYNETTTIKGDRAATEASLGAEITSMLRAEGWKLTSVDYAKSNVLLADPDHPVYRMSQHGLNGAANILPYGNDSAGALIFMHSACISAGPLAAEILSGASLRRS